MLTSCQFERAARYMALSIGARQIDKSISSFICSKALEHGNPANRPDSILALVQRGCAPRGMQQIHCMGGQGALGSAVAHVVPARMRCGAQRARRRVAAAYGSACERLLEAKSLVRNDPGESPATFRLLWQWGAAPLRLPHVSARGFTRKTENRKPSTSSC